MPDIMMCSAEGCDRSTTCYRHEDSGTKPDPHRQTYWLRDETSSIGETCAAYWKTTPLVKAMHDGSLP